MGGDDQRAPGVIREVAEARRDRGVPYRKCGIARTAVKSPDPYRRSVQYTVSTEPGPPGYKSAVRR